MVLEDEGTKKCVCGSVMDLYMQEKIWFCPQCGNEEIIDPKTELELLASFRTPPEISFLTLADILSQRQAACTLYQTGESPRSSAFQRRAMTVTRGNY